MQKKHTLAVLLVFGAMIHTHIIHPMNIERETYKDQVAHALTIHLANYFNAHAQLKQERGQLEETENILCRIVEEQSDTSENECLVDPLSVDKIQRQFDYLYHFLEHDCGHDVLPDSLASDRAVSSVFYIFDSVTRDYDLTGLTDEEQTALAEAEKKIYRWKRYRGQIARLKREAILDQKLDQKKNNR